MMTGRIKLEKMVLTGLMMALVTVMTVAVAIPVPFTNGYIHPGDCMIFLSVLILGWKYGAVAAGAGSALADLTLGFVHWAPWTLVIKGGMALIMGLILEKSRGSKRNLFLSMLIIAVFWLLFHFGVSWIVRYESTHNAAALISAAGVAQPSALGEFLATVQSQLMIAALAIPVVLAAVALWARRRENIFIPVEQLVGMAGSGIFMVFGYFVAGGLLYGNFAVAAFSIPANILQFTGGFLLAALAAAALSKTPIKRYFAVAMIGADRAGEKNNVR